MSRVGDGGVGVGVGPARVGGSVCVERSGVGPRVVTGAETSDRRVTPRGYGRGVRVVLRPSPPSPVCVRP